MEKELRWYQAADVHTLTESLDSFGVVYGTGGGKTLVGLSILQAHLDNGDLDYGLIAVPSEAIRDQFVRCSHTKVVGLDKPLTIGLVREATSGRALDTHLMSRGLIVLTSGVLLLNRPFEGDTRIPERLQRLDLSRVAVMFDEAHHVPKVDEPGRSEYVQMGQLERDLRERGTTIGKLSGTPERTDGRPVLDSSYKVTPYRDMVFLMSEGRCPQSITSEVKHVEGLSVDTKDSYLVPIDPLKGGQKVAQIWADQGYPPATCRIKPSSSDDNGKAIEGIKQAVDALSSGYQAIDASGLDPVDFYAALAEEARTLEAGTAQYRDNQTLFIGMQRIVEGVDSPSRALGILYGIPRSMPLLRQYLGRHARCKFKDDGSLLFEGYPDEWANRIHLVMLIGGVSDEAARRDEHVGMLFEVTALIGALNCAADLGKLFRRLWDGLSGRSGPRPPRPEGEAPTEKVMQLKSEAENSIQVHESPLDDRRYQNCGVAERLRYIREWASVQGEDLTDSEVEGLRTALVMDALRSVPRGEDRGLRALEKVKDEALEAQLLALFEEFKDEVPETPRGLEIDGELMERYQARSRALMDSMGPLGSISEVLGRVDLFRERHPEGHYPTLQDEDPVDDRFRFRRHHDHLRAGLYGTPIGLGELILSQGGVPSWQDQAFTVSTRVTEWITNKASPARYRQKFYAGGKDRVSRIRSQFGEYPVVQYYECVLLVAERCKVPAMLQGLSVLEADRLGKRIRYLGEVESLYLARGISAARDRIAELL